MPINSSDLLDIIRNHPGAKKPGALEINELAARLGIGLTKLIALLTELEHRDEISMEIKTAAQPQTDELIYEGTIRLMDTPPDELSEFNENP